MLGPVWNIVGFLLLVGGLATQTYTVLNVESAQCSGFYMQYQQTLVGIVAGSGSAATTPSCVDFNVALEGNGFSVYNMAFPAATDVALSWTLFDKGCGVAPALGHGDVDFGECSPIVAQSGQLQGSSVIALRDPLVPVTFVIHGFSNAQCSGDHGGTTSGNVIGECHWFTSAPQLGQVQMLGYSAESDVVYFGLGCGKGPSNTGSATFVAAPRGKCVNSGMGVYFLADVTFPSTTPGAATTTTTTMTTTATATTGTSMLSTTTTTTTPLRETSSSSTTTHTTPHLGTLTSTSATSVPDTSAPTSLGATTTTTPPQPQSTSTTVPIDSTTTTTPSTLTIHTTTPSSAWNQLSEVERISVVLGSFIGVLLLCIGIGYLIFRSQRQDTLYEPSGEKYALLQSMHTEDEMDSEELLDGYHEVSQEV